MFVRRRPMLRAAAIGGTYAAGRSMGRASQQRQSAEAEQNERIANLEQQQAAPQSQQPAQAPAAAAAAPSLLDQLDQLSALHERGTLTDGEYTAAKAKLLGT
jgi:hypothetical protein